MDHRLAHRCCTVTSGRAAAGALAPPTASGRRDSSDDMVRLPDGGTPPFRRGRDRRARHRAVRSAARRCRGPVVCGPVRTVVARGPAPVGDVQLVRRVGRDQGAEIRLLDRGPTENDAR